ncbi:MAG: LysR family transcriptional regulator [Henriciella sp.]|nr:LysR family transcriptional regulator [Henriciella sp.]
MDKIRALECFAAVAKYESFSAAAKAMGVEASSVSRRIQELEASLGTVLIHRTTRVVKLTELGDLYLDHVRPIIAAITHADDSIRDRPDEPVGTVRLTVSPGYGEVCVMPALRALMARYPGLVFDIEMTDQVFNLDESDIDIAIRATAAPPERSIARKLSDNEFVLVGSKDYLDQHGYPTCVDDLQAHKTLLFRRPNGVLFWQARQNDQWIEVTKPPSFVSNMGRLLVDEALAGAGLALVPIWGVSEYLSSRQLIQLPLDDATLHISRNDNSGIYLLYHRPKYTLKKVQTVVDFLFQELA